MKRILKKTTEQKGVALMMVMMSIVVLTAIMVNFTFDTKINKIKAFNLQEKAQARLNAEMGLHLAVTRLALYAEAFNRREQAGEGAQQFASTQLLNQIWQAPFALPIPEIPGMSQSAKGMIEAFNEQSFLDGQMTLTIKNISNRYNLNALRVTASNMANSQGQEASEQVYALKNNIIDFYTQTVQTKLRDLSFNNPELADQVDRRIDEVRRLFDHVIYFTSDDGMADNLYRGGLPSVDFSERDLQRKFGPLSSMSELNLLPAWDSFIMEHVSELFTVHNNIGPDPSGRNIVSAVIDLNTLTTDHLVTLFNMNQDEAARFMELKNDPTLPIFFRSPDDFINFAANTAAIIPQDEITRRFEELQQMGIIFETYPSLFEVKSSGIKGRTRYTIKAYVATPVKIPPPPPSPQEMCLRTEGAQWLPDNDPPCLCPDGMQFINNQCSAGDAQQPSNEFDQDIVDPQTQQPQQGQQSAQPTQLLPPIILELFLT